MAEKFRVTGVTDSLVDGVRYRSIFTEPLNWEDRPEPYLSIGPLSIQMDASEEVVNFFRDKKNHPVPGVYELVTGTRRASGGKSKTVVFQAALAGAARPSDNKAAA